MAKKKKKKRKETQQTCACPGRAASDHLSGGSRCDHQCNTPFILLQMPGWI